MQNNYQFQLQNLKTAYTHLVEIDHMNRHLNPILVITHVNVLLTHVHLESALLFKDCFETFLNALNHYGYKLIVYFLEYCIFFFSSVRMHYYLHLIKWHVKNNSGILQSIARSNSYSFILTTINQISPRLHIIILLSNLQLNYFLN